MAIFLTVLRAFGSLLFGAIIFFAFFAFLGAQQVRGNLLSASFYTDALAENQVYDRIYDELLVDPDFQDEARRLLGDFDAPASDTAELAKAILPPDYLQAQTEASIQGIISYLRGDSDDPQAYINLGPPIGRIKTTILTYIESSMDRMEAVPLNDPGELTRELEFFFLTIEDGDIPRQVPSLEGVPLSLRSQAFDQAVDSLRRNSTLPPSALDTLEAEGSAIKEELSQGRIRLALKLAAPILAEPVINDAIHRLRLDLDSQDRLDLVARAAKDSGMTREAFLEDVNSVRLWIDSGVSMTPIVALVILSLATLTMGVVHLPHWRFALVWPSLVLFFTGAVFLMVGAVLKTQLANWLTLDCGALPSSVCQMSTDVFGTMGSAIGGGVLWPSVALAIVGGVVLLATGLLSLKKSGV